MFACVIFSFFFLKTYVQDKLLEAAPLVYRMLTQHKGHFYVCGDCAMAEDVANTLRLVFQKAGGLDAEESEALLVLLRVNHLLVFELEIESVSASRSNMFVFVFVSRTKDAIKKISLGLLIARPILSSLIEGSNRVTTITFRLLISVFYSQISSIPFEYFPSLNILFFFFRIPIIIIILSQYRGTLSFHFFFRTTYEIDFFASATQCSSDIFVTF